MADAVHSISAPATLTFPIDRVRPPGADNPIFARSTYEQCALTSLVATQFDDAPDAFVRAALCERRECADLIAGILDHNRQAIAFFRAALAQMIAADRRIAGAAK